VIGIFGGTFDPVHYGHLGLAQAVNRDLNIQRIIFVPLGNPPHRDRPRVSSEARVKMLRAAIQPYDGYEISTVEVDKTTPSWTVETLAYFTEHLPNETLCLLMGSDAFRQINEWYEWHTLLDYAHLVVVTRAGVPMDLSDEVAGFLDRHRVDTLPEPVEGPQGNVLLLQIDVPRVSSTQVRQAIEAGEALDGLLPESVELLIRTNNYYGYQ
jgi:nicotinate-nucleotide adenylyltransferase